MLPTALALLVITTAVGCSAVYVPFEDSPAAYPLLLHAGSMEPLRWVSGELAELRLSSQALRVSDHGVRFVPASMGLFLSGRGNGYTCTARPGVLCATANGTTLFPENAADARIPGRADLVSDSLGRTVATAERCERDAARAIVATTSYAATLCDVTQKGFTFLAAGDTVWAARLNGDAWYYALVCVAVVVLATCLAQNIASLLEDTTPPGNLLLELGAALLLPATSWYHLSLVTTGDVLFYAFSAGYVVFNTACWAALLGVRQHGQDGTQTDKKGGGAPVNVLLGALLHALCRVYDGLESEYVTPLLFLLLVRAFHKAQHVFAEPDRSEIFDFLARCSVLIDFMLAGLAHQVGFRVLFVQSHVADLFFAVLAVAAYCVASMLEPGGQSKRDV